MVNGTVYATHVLDRKHHLLERHPFLFQNQFPNVSPLVFKIFPASVMFLPNIHFLPSQCTLYCYYSEFMSTMLSEVDDV